MSICNTALFGIPTQTVCTPALQRPLSAQVVLWELAPDTPSSTAAPASEHAEPKPCQVKTVLLYFAGTRV